MCNKDHREKENIKELASKFWKFEWQERIRNIVWTVALFLDNYSNRTHTFLSVFSSNNIEIIDSGEHDIEENKSVSSRNETARNLSNKVVTKVEYIQPLKTVNETFQISAEFSYVLVPKTGY